MERVTITIMNRALDPAIAKDDPNIREFWWSKGGQIRGERKCSISNRMEANVTLDFLKNYP